MKQAIRLTLAAGLSIDLLPNFTGDVLTEKTLASDVQQNLATQRAFEVLSLEGDDCVAFKIEIVPVL